MPQMHIQIRLSRQIVSPEKGRPFAWASPEAQTLVPIIDGVIRMLSHLERLRK
jgi:hypothetical protein